MKQQLTKRFFLRNKANIPYKQLANRKAALKYIADDINFIITSLITSLHH